MSGWACHNLTPKVFIEECTDVVRERTKTFILKYPWVGEDQQVVPEADETVLTYLRRVWYAGRLGFTKW